MSSYYFLDTSALVKYYHEECGTERVSQIIESAHNTIAISEISILEFHSQLALKVRSTEYPTFSSHTFDQVCGLFCYHIVQGKLNVLHLPDGFVFKATDLIRANGCNYSLRHMDAIQLCHFLGYLQLQPDAVFVASDKKLLGLVSVLGLKSFDPEIEI